MTVSPVLAGPHCNFQVNLGHLAESCLKAESKRKGGEKAQRLRVCIALGVT